MYTMDYMEQSIIHIRAPHEVHIGAKVMAAQRSISMNQYIINLIEADMEGSKLSPVNLTKGIEAARRASPKQKKIIQKAVDTFEELTAPEVASVRCTGHDSMRFNCGKLGCEYS